MKIGIASDHGGILVKEELINYIAELGYEVINYGTDTEDSVDYPFYAFKIGEELQQKHINLGILLCRTGIGMSMAANKVKGVRCAKVDNEEEVILTREHNDANVIALNASKDLGELKQLVKLFITTQFSNDERHVRRIRMMDDYDN